MGPTCLPIIVMCVVYILITVAETDKHITYMHFPCAIIPAVRFMVPGKQIRPKGKQTFSLFPPLSWSMLIGVSSLEFPILNFKTCKNKKKKDKTRNLENLEK